MCWVLPGDLNASEMTMADDDRIQLMLMVKKGEISKDQAVDAVSPLTSTALRHSDKKNVA